MQQKNQLILILDDDEDIRDLLSAVLSFKGYSVSALDDIDIDLDKIQEKPDLILLDVLLSNKSGIEVCRSLKNNSSLKDIPVIMFSGLSDTKQACLNAGADEFIIKPFQIPVLHNIMKKLLGKAVAL